MTTMLEKMARAAAMTAVGDLPHGETTADGLWEWMSDDQRDKMLAIVRAALQAIREPDRQAVTRGMVAMMTDDLQPTRDEVSAGFTAIIDAVLAEDKA